MTKLAAILLAAYLATVQAQYEINYISGDPHIWSHNAGYQTCSFSSSAWLQTFFSRRINIESIFSDYVPGQQHPTVQTSFRITFTRPGTSQTETYTAPDPNQPFSNTFVSGSTTTGWVDIVVANGNLLIIVDQTTGSVIMAEIQGGALYNLFLIAPSWLVTTGRGLLVQGCPYKDTYDYNTAMHWQTYEANPNWGRKKREAVGDASQCKDLAAVFGRGFPQYKSLGAEPIQRMCEIDARFIKGTADQIKQRIVNLQTAESFRQKYFPDGFVPEAYRKP